MSEQSAADVCSFYVSVINFTQNAKQKPMSRMWEETFPPTGKKCKYAKMMDKNNVITVMPQRGALGSSYDDTSDFNVMT